jgi:hypothetical protein
MRAAEVHCPWRRDESVPVLGVIDPMNEQGFIVGEETRSAEFSNALG